MSRQRVRLDEMTATEAELRLALDMMLEKAKERPFAKIGGKITLHPGLPDELDTNFGHAPGSHQCLERGTARTSRS